MPDRQQLSSQKSLSSSLSKHASLEHNIFETSDLVNDEELDYLSGDSCNVRTISKELRQRKEKSDK